MCSLLSICPEVGTKRWFTKCSSLTLTSERLPFDKVSEVIDRDGRAHQTVAGEDVVYNSSAVVLKESNIDLSMQFCYRKKNSVLLQFPQ